MPRRFFFDLLSSINSTEDSDYVPDGELLRRFKRGRDSAAFELLVRRHAHTVWTACRRVLNSGTDAEDAFQATFLVLIQRAGIVRGASVGGFLHRVAVNAALKLREKSTRVPVATPEQLEELSARSGASADNCAVVHEELACLPERYRLPVVLCELEGHSHAEAAKVLGWPVGSVSGRLSRARVLLRERLARRGVTAPAVLLPIAGLPSTSIRDTTSIAVGNSAVHPQVSNLTKGVLSAMHTQKLKQIAAWVVPIGVVILAGFGSYTAYAQRFEPTVIKQPNVHLAALGQKDPSAAKEPAVPTPLKVPKELLEKRLEMARSAYTQYRARIQAAINSSFSELFGWSERWLEAELALANTQADRVKALMDYLDRTRDAERMTANFAKAGQGIKADADAAAYYRVDAEIRLLKEGVEPHPAKENEQKSEKK